MGRKKITDVEVANTSNEAVATVENEQPSEATTSEKARPVVSWKLMADRNVSIEVSIWPNSITLQNGEMIKVLSMTVVRNYRDKDGVWHKGGSYRTHEIPVLQHLLAKAHSYALDERLEPPPF